MIENEAVVTHIEGDFAWLTVERQGGCSSCSSGGCGTASLASLFGQRPTPLRVDNRLQAQPGEQVVIGIEERSLLIGALLIYLLPLLLLLVAAIVGEQWGGEVAAVVLGAIGLGLGLRLSQPLARYLTPVPLTAVMLRRTATQGWRVGMIEQ